MMIQRSLTLLVLLLAPETAQRDVWAQAHPGHIIIGETVQLQSNRLHESRTLLISKPAGYHKETDRYPVLYLLDGNIHFRYTAAIVGFLAVNDRIPKMLVVGIENEDSRKRTHDLTPPSNSEI